jgi:hypothetical protein
MILKPFLLAFGSTEKPHYRATFAGLSPSAQAS